MFMYVSVRMNVRPCLVNMITQTSKAWMNLMGVSIGRGRGCDRGSRTLSITSSQQWLDLYVFVCCVVFNIHILHVSEDH